MGIGRSCLFTKTGTRVLCRNDFARTIGGLVHCNLLSILGRDVCARLQALPALPATARGDGRPFGSRSSADIAHDLAAQQLKLHGSGSVQLSEHSGIRYFGILLSLIVLWYGLAGFWRSWSPEQREK